MLLFGDCRGVQPLRTERLVYSLLIMQIWATCRQGWRRSDGLAWNGLLPFGEYMAISGLLRLSGPRFPNFGYFLRLLPRSCSTLTLLPFQLATAWLELDLQFELQSLLIFYLLLFCFFCRALAILDGAISGLVVLLEISPSTFAGRWPYMMALYRDLSYFSRDFTVYSP